MPYGLLGKVGLRLLVARCVGFSIRWVFGDGFYLVTGYGEVRD